MEVAGEAAAAMRATRSTGMSAQLAVSQGTRRPRGDLPNSGGGLVKLSDSSDSEERSGTRGGSTNVCARGDAIGVASASSDSLLSSSVRPAPRG